MVPLKPLPGFYFFEIRDLSLFFCIIAGMSGGGWRPPEEPILGGVVFWEPSPCGLVFALVTRLWYIAWSDVSSIWIEDVVNVSVQINITNDGDTTNLGSSKESKITEESSFTFQARAEAEAFEIEADMRRSWNKYLDSMDER